MKIQKIHVAVISFLAFFVIIGVLYYTSFDIHIIKDLLYRNYYLGVAVFIGLYIIAGMTFIPISPVTIFATSLFPFHIALFYIFIGNFIGAILPFLISRKFGETRVHAYIHKKYPEADKIDHHLKNHGLVPVILARVVPFLPYSVFNYMLGLTQLNFSTYALGTVLGILPISSLYLYIGYSLFSFDAFHIISAVGVISLILVLLWWYREKLLIKEGEI